jgi:CBS domain-containing protein
MSRGVIALPPREPAITAIALMLEHRIRTIPIVTETTAGLTVVGVITRSDLTAARAE